MISINWESAGQAVSEAMLRKSWNAGILARKAGVDRKTVYSLLKGNKARFTTLSYIEQALEISVISEQTKGLDVRNLQAATDLGGYTKDNFEGYIGNYYMFRNSYDYDDRVICSIFEILWDYDSSCLAYREIPVSYTHLTLPTICSV